MTTDIIKLSDDFSIIIKIPVKMLSKNEVWTPNTPVVEKKIHYGDIKYAEIMNHMIAECHDMNDAILLQHCCPETLELVIQFYKYYAKYLPTKPKSDNDSDFEYCLSINRYHVEPEQEIKKVKLVLDPWIKQFCDNIYQKSKTLFFDLLRTTDFLETKFLFNCLKIFIAMKLIECNTTENIRKEFTKEEKDHLKF